LHHLTLYGWNPHFAAKLLPGESPAHVARVVQEHKEAYLVHAAPGNLWAEISGKIRHHAAIRADFPAVGDWVVLRGGGEAGGIDPAAEKSDGPVQISRILPRKTTLARRLEGNRDNGITGDDQLLAVNVDLALLATSLNESFSLRRLERYLTLARDAAVRPIILLTKADLCDNPTPYLEQIRTLDPHNILTTCIISVVTGQGMPELRTLLAPGTTAVILGSSGIGKSTLVNYLAEADIQDMMEIREFDDKGRHCTTFRHLIKTAAGGLIIDTPGLRGLSLGEATDALLATFSDIDQLATACRFSNCQHDTEPGCAIKAALEANTLSPDRFESFLKLHREQSALARRENRILDRKKKKLDKKQTIALQKRIQQKRPWEKH